MFFGVRFSWWTIRPREIASVPMRESSGKKVISRGCWVSCANTKNCLARNLCKNRRLKRARICNVHVYRKVTRLKADKRQALSLCSSEIHVDVKEFEEELADEQVAARVGYMACALNNLIVVDFNNNTRGGEPPSSNQCRWWMLVVSATSVLALLLRFRNGASQVESSAL